MHQTNQLLQRSNYCQNGEEKCYRKALTQFYIYGATPAVNLHQRNSQPGVQKIMSVLPSLDPNTKNKIHLSRMHIEPAAEWQEVC